MKKEYIKPVLAKRDRLAEIAAVIGIPVSNAPT